MRRASKTIVDIPYTSQFTVNGRGDHPSWEKAEAIPMPCRQELQDAADYKTWFKALWSPMGVYFLIDCADQLLTCTGLPDNGNLWVEDVAEVFIWPDETVSTYFEYCISPMGNEIPILCPDIDGEHIPWLPWNYQGRRRVQKAVTVRGGEQKPGAKVTGWTSEFFIPYHLLAPLRNARAEVGMTWRANVYRIDYDGTMIRYFAWKHVGQSFHKYMNFPTLRFCK
ncbi:MAG: carbohydrate-binding family 9-like protein [Phycisphaeraceae bacterium]|nr:carbohydrate-binding family 9-like protein [Phycisphaeraceae bacterium]